MLTMMRTVTKDTVGRSYNLENLLMFCDIVILKLTKIVSLQRVNFSRF